MTIEKLVLEFGISPVLKNMASVCQDLSQKAEVGTTGKPFYEMASEKLLKLVTELDEQEKMINHILFNTKR